MFHFSHKKCLSILNTSIQFSATLRCNDHVKISSTWLEFPKRIRIVNGRIRIPFFPTILDIRIRITDICLLKTYEYPRIVWGIVGQFFRELRKQKNVTISRNTEGMNSVKIKTFFCHIFGEKIREYRFITKELHSKLISRNSLRGSEFIFFPHSCWRTINLHCEQQYFYMAKCGKVWNLLSIEKYFVKSTRY